MGKAGNLGHHGDGRTYTIWETLENTAKRKSDRLYFIIDEAHRGMQGRAAGTATSIMQRFLKGSRPHRLSPMPVVIGMSATAERFNRLVGETSSGLNKVITTPNEVRASGLLKDRIVITYPDDIIADGDAVSEHSFYLPETISVRMDKDGAHYYDHLFVDEGTGYAAIKLNGWESELIEEESKRSDFVCWLRNPPRERWALCIPYEIDGETKPTYPDFIIIRRDEQLGYVIDILEPHNPEFKDNLGKAKGLAAYAEKEYRIGRIQLIRKAKDTAGKTRFKRLDFSKGEVRKRVLKAINTDELDHIFDECG